MGNWHRPPWRVVIARCEHQQVVAYYRSQPSCKSCEATMSTMPGVSEALILAIPKVHLELLATIWRAISDMRVEGTRLLRGVREIVCRVMPEYSTRERAAALTLHNKKTRLLGYRQK